MTPLFQESSQAEHLYRQILDNALDAFIAIDRNSIILEWSRHAEDTFGWTRAEAIGQSLTDTIIPQRYRLAHVTGMRRYLNTGAGKLINRRVEMPARCKNGAEIPVELTVTRLSVGDRTLFFAAVRDISQRKALEEALHHQASITASILNSMAGAVVVADLSERLTLVNPAGRRLLNLEAMETGGEPSIRSFSLWRPDGTGPYPLDERPTVRALRGEHVDGLIALVRHENLREGTWVSVNARPLTNSHGVRVGAVAVFHDISELRRREETLAAQASLLQEQAGLLDLARDAIFARTTEDIVTYWNRSAERIYGYARGEAIGQHSHTLLKTRFPVPLDEIVATVREHHYWEGELIQFTRDGREIIVFSKWALELQEGRPARYLETNTDITQQVQTARALKQTQEDFRLLVEASTDYAIMMLDPQGVIMSWNSGAERILELRADEAIGKPVSGIFTAEDRDFGEPVRELEEARTIGRSEDDRWHLRADGTRFWATGVVTPLWNADGTLRGFVKIMRDQTARRLAEEQTRFLANHDGLTGLPNRVYFSNELH